MELFTQKVVTKLSKIWVWDPGSGINLFRIPDPGVKEAPIPDPGSGSATLQKTNLFEKFFCLLLFEGTLHHFSKINVKKKSQNSRNQGFFLLFLLDDRRGIRIRSRIRTQTSDLLIRIQEAQKHTDPTDSNSGPDPQHCMYDHQWPSVHGNFFQAVTIRGGRTSRGWRPSCNTSRGREKELSAASVWPPMLQVSSGLESRGFF